MSEIPWQAYAMLGSMAFVLFVAPYILHYVYPVKTPKTAVKEIAVAEKKKEVPMSDFKGWSWTWGAHRKSRSGGDMPDDGVLHEVLLQEIRDLVSHPQDTETLKNLIRENTKELKQLNAFLRQVYGDPE
jgi:hypothetical protein